MQVFTSSFVPPDKGCEMAMSRTIFENLVVEASSLGRLARDPVIFLTNIHGGLRCLFFLIVVEVVSLNKTIEDGS